MRIVAGIVLATVWLTAPASVRADDREKAVAVIEQAIKAHGGAEALNKAQKCSRSGEGMLALQGNAPFKTEETIGLPDRCRMDLDFGSTRLILVLNGDKGWVQAGGKTNEMVKMELAERREELYVWQLMTLAPLRQDGFELKLLADAKVNGQDASVVKVSRKGYPDARLFFDKKSGLLVRISRRATEAGISFPKDYYYSDYKDCGGAKMPGKEITFMYSDKKLSEVKFTRYKALESVEDKTFDKP
ncbi:MAG TPA: hypothetical protein VH682_31035 [Gemmataceae bacterium]|jgi:hypothetical protein